MIWGSIRIWSFGSFLFKLFIFMLLTVICVESLLSSNWSLIIVVKDLSDGNCEEWKHCVQLFPTPQPSLSDGVVCIGVGAWAEPPQAVEATGQAVAHSLSPGGTTHPTQPSLQHTVCHVTDGEGSGGYSLGQFFRDWVRIYSVWILGRPGLYTRVFLPLSTKMQLVFETLAR